MSVFTPEISPIPLPVDGSGVTQPVSGTVTANAGTGTFSTNGLTDAQLRATPVPVSSTPTTASSSTVTQISSTGSNQTLLAANPNRKKAILFFTSGNWHVKFGVGASATSRTFFTNSTNFYVEIDTWTGQIDTLCTSSGKLVDVTELT